MIECKGGCGKALEHNDRAIVIYQGAIHVPSGGVMSVEKIDHWHYDCWVE